MFKSFFAIIILSAAPFFPNYAQNYEFGTYDTTVRQFLSYCPIGSKTNAYCQMYILGMTHSIGHFSDPISSFILNRRGMCVPSWITNGSLVMLIDDFLISNRSYADHPLASVIYGALARQYPCQ